VITWKAMSDNKRILVAAVLNFVVVLFADGLMRFKSLISSFGYRTLCIILAFGISAAGARSETIPEPDLGPEGLLGNWEAIAEFGSALNAVYRMEIVKTGESYLAEVREYPDSFAIYFIARLTTIDIKAGKVNLTFTTFGAARPYESIRIEGSAFGKKENATLSGKVTKSSGDYSETENVTFRKAPLFNALLEASKAAEAAIKKQRAEQ
jgi:hypothetical protein